MAPVSAHLSIHSGAGGTPPQRVLRSVLMVKVRVKVRVKVMVKVRVRD